LPTQQAIHEHVVQHLKKRIYIAIIFLVYIGSANAQITGQFVDEEFGIPGIEVYLKNSNQKVESDFDGYFTIPIPSKNLRYNLIIKTHLELTIEIQNLELKGDKLDLGEIKLPIYKVIDSDEYTQLTKLEKENCYPIYCWTQLLGYYFTNELEKNNLTLNCKENISKFEFNSSSKRVIVDWNEIKHCK
jgi:hypothetical protein